MEPWQCTAIKLGFIGQSYVFWGFIVEFCILLADLWGLVLTNKSVLFCRQRIPSWLRFGSDADCESCTNHNMWPRREWNRFHVGDEAGGKNCTGKWTVKCAPQVAMQFIGPGFNDRFTIAVQFYCHSEQSFSKLSQGLSGARSVLGGRDCGELGC